MKLAIVDYDVGNIESIQNAFARLGLQKPILTRDFQALEFSDGLILPGVGAFSACMENLNSIGLSDYLTHLVVRKKKPILGICVGMHVMGHSSSEDGIHNGLSWIPGEVKKLKLEGSEYKVPHVGWNNVKIREKKGIFSKLGEDTHFYFDHSYHFQCEMKYVAAIAEYGIQINAALRHQNIFGVQFHPEKSANNGLKLFRGFMEYVEKC